MLTKVHMSKLHFFSSSHVWMLELDHKEDWAPKNWYFWVVVLEKTVEGPLYKDQRVNPKRNQSWIFIVSTDSEAEAQILWPHDVKSQLTAKDCDAGKDWGPEGNGAAEDEIVGWITYSTDISLSKLWEIVKYSEAWHAAVHGVTKSQTRLSDWTTISSFVTSFQGTFVGWAVGVLYIFWIQVLRVREIVCCA